jgi:hypothetical protein
VSDVLQKEAQLKTENIIPAKVSAVRPERADLSLNLVIDHGGVALVSDDVQRAASPGLVRDRSWPRYHADNGR